MKLGLWDVGRATVVGPRLSSTEVGARCLDNQTSITDPLTGRQITNKSRGVWANGHRLVDGEQSGLIL